MSKVLKEVLAANELYAAQFGDRGRLPLPPARRFAVLTCMDARLDPARYAGLNEGDAHVIRNAGGRATDDAIRSLVISHKLLGTLEWFVIHHTNCGMELFSDGVIADLLEDDLGTAAFDGQQAREERNIVTNANGPPDRRVTSILFVCRGNTCRSVMAEALARRRFGEAVKTSSAS